MPGRVGGGLLIGRKEGVAERLERKGKNGTVVRPYSPTAEEHGPNGLAVRFLDGSCVFEAPL